MYPFIRTTAVLLLSLVLANSGTAQTVHVQNGGTAQIQNSGVWHLQGGTVDFGDAGATARLREKTGGRVTGGQLTAIRTLNNPSSADPAGLGAVISASVDLGAVTVTRGHTVQTGGGNSSVERFYNLSPSKNNSGLSATLKHSYHDAEVGGLSESDLELFKSTDGGSTWSEEGADSRDGTANTVTLSGISSFSRWTLGSETQPLPVEMAGFKGSTAENGVQLTWRTTSEQNNAGFRVQRKPLTGATMRRGAGNWQTIGRVDGAGTTDQPQTYRFTDEGLPYAADSLSYRLRQVDIGGTTHTTDPITIDRGSVERLALKKTFPNPARSQVTVRFAVPDDIASKDVTLQLYDVLGRQVHTVVTQRSAGRHKLKLNVQDEASGVYVLRLRAGGQIRTRKLTVVR